VVRLGVIVFLTTDANASRLLVATVGLAVTAIFARRACSSPAAADDILRRHGGCRSASSHLTIAFADRPADLTIKVEGWVARFRSHC
jgi:hypothetical protein